MSYFFKSIFFQNVHLQLKAEYTLYFINDVGQQGILKLFCFDDFFFFFGGGGEGIEMENLTLIISKIWLIF